MIENKKGKGRRCPRCKGTGKAELKFAGTKRFLGFEVPSYSDGGRCDYCGETGRINQ